MSPPHDSSTLLWLLARYTPDSRRWRRRVAGVTAIGAPLALYATVAIISGVKTGMIYNLLILLFGVLTLVLPAIATATVLAPDSGLTQMRASRREDAVETLKRRYARGEINQDEFTRRLDDVIGRANASREQRNNDAVGETIHDVEVGSTD